MTIERPPAMRPGAASDASRTLRAAIDARQAATHSSRWLLIQRWIALVTTVIIAMRISVVGSIEVTAGFVLAIGLVPLWLPALRQFRGARLLMFFGVAAMVSGILLTQLNSVDHASSTTKMIAGSVAVLTVLSGTGVLLWARTLVPVGYIVVAFGLGLILSISTTTGLYSRNAWRFGFSVPVTVFVLGLTAVIGKRWLDLAAVLVLTAASALNDARSGSSILLIGAFFLVWQMLPRFSSRKGSAAKVVLGVGVLGVVVYFLAQSLILGGYLGEATQQRSQVQVDTSGSLLLGGRPEMAATAALMTAQPGGFGSGTLPSFGDLQVAKMGMSAINYDPNNGYVERFMFGSGFELHSTIGDIWADFGIVGIGLLIVVAGVFLRGLGEAIADRRATGILLFLAVKTLWNLPFSPFASSASLLMLLLGTIMVRHPASTSASVSTPADFPDPESARSKVPKSSDFRGGVAVRRPSRAAAGPVPSARRVRHPAAARRTTTVDR